MTLTEELWRDLLEKDDRTSPEDYPDMALITFEEFEGYIALATAVPADRSDPLRETDKASVSTSPPSPPAVWSGEDKAAISQSQPCGDGAQPILPPVAEPSAVRIGPRFVDDFNGDDDHLLDSIDALLRLNADGALSHRIPGLARQLLHNAAARLEARQ